MTNENNPPETGEASKATNPTEDQIKDMRHFSGEEARSIMSIPFLSFNGKDGIFYLPKYEEKEEPESLGHSISVVIIRVRKRLDSKPGSPEEFYTAEFDSNTQPLELMQRGSQDVVDCGTYTELKSRFPQLQYREVIYFFFKGEIFKMSIGGASLSPFWNYLKSFGRKDTLLRYETTLGSVEEKHPQFGPYFRLSFGRGLEVPDWQGFWEQLQILRDTEVTRTIEGKKEKLGIESPATETPEEKQIREKAEIDKEIHPEDGINVEAVPF